MHGQHGTVKLNLTLKYKDQLLKQQRAIKKEKQDHDGKKKINGKDAQKDVLKVSPDLIEALIYREYWNLAPSYNFTAI